MQTPLEFMNGYFREMVLFQQQHAAGYNTLVERFFARGYKPHAVENNIAIAAAETVLDVVEAGERVTVTTSGYGEHARFRYTLEAWDASYRITLLEWECGLCSRRGGIKPDCKMCRGRGWQRLPI